jgi:hypothetical protein
MAFVGPIVLTARNLETSAHRVGASPDGLRLGSKRLPSRHVRSPHSSGGRGAAGLRATASQSVQSGIEQAWEPFRERMKASNESPPVEEWNELFCAALAAKDESAKAIWVLDRMRETGRKATARDLPLARGPPGGVPARREDVGGQGPTRRRFATGRHGKDATCHSAAGGV